MIPGMLALAATAEQAVPVSDIDFTALMIKMLVLLAVIVVLGFIVIRFIGNVGRPRGRGGDRNFEIISWLKLEPKKTVYLVRIGKRTFALGAAESSLNVISEMTDEELGDT
jgi:flagellar biogenesis protein FliO